MAFEELREQLKDEWGQLVGKIQENPAFNNLREKFEAQSINTQRAIVAVVGILVALFVLSFPYGYISDSQDNMSQFQENRQLIQDLLHASQAAQEPSPLPPPTSAEMLESQVKSMLQQNQLAPEQIGEVHPLADNPAKGLAPAVVQQTGIAVQVKKLNLTQVVTLANLFQGLGPGIKLMGMDIVQSEGQTHYYDMVAKIVSFSLPSLSEPDAGGGPSKGKFRRGHGE